MSVIKIILGSIIFISTMTIFSIISSLFISNDWFVNSPILLGIFILFLILLSVLFSFLGIYLIIGDLI